MSIQIPLSRYPNYKAWYVKSHALILPRSFLAGTASGLHLPPDFQFYFFLQYHNSYSYPLNRTSSIAKAFLPQSPHDVIAIPLMNSAVAIDIECLQFGHLYCLVGIIWATRHYHASGHYPKFHSIVWPDHFHVQVLSPFWLHCILFRRQSKSLLFGCTVILSPNHHSFHGYLNRVNKQNLINSFGFQEDNGNNYLEIFSLFQNIPHSRSLKPFYEEYQHKFDSSSNCCRNNSGSVWMVTKPDCIFRHIYIIFLYRTGGQKYVQSKKGSFLPSITNGMVK